MNYFIIFIAGLLIGSYLNVCIYRIAREESIAYPFFRCPNCGSVLKSFDLIPLVSYILIRGKCRYCKASISVQYPVVELLCGIIFTLLFHRFSLSYIFLKYSMLSAVLLVIAVIDLQTQEIPDGLLIFGAAVMLVFITADKDVSIKSAFLGSATGFGAFLAIAIISRAMGGGDIKLMALIGLAVGWKSILLVSLFSFIIGAVVSLVLLLFKIKGRKDYIPFAPFIFTAFVVTLLWGNEILSLYIYSLQ